MFAWAQMYLTHGHPLNDLVSLHKGWLTFVRRTLIVYLAALLLGLWLNVSGYQSVNALFGFLFLAVGIPFLLPGNLAFALIIGFFLGQPGNSPGLSIKDGVDTGKELLFLLFRTTGYVLFYGSMPFFALFIFSFKEHAMNAIAMLALAVPVSIGAGMIFYATDKHKAGFFTKLVYWLQVTVLVLALGATLTETYFHYVATAEEQLIRDAEKADASITSEEDREALKKLLGKIRDKKIRVANLVPLSLDEEKTYALLASSKSLPHEEKEMLESYKERALYQKYQNSLNRKTPTGIANKVVAVGKQAVTSVSAVGEDLFYERTIEIEASSFRSKEQCGILAGKRTFELPTLTYAFIEGDRYDLTAFIRINGVLPKQSFVVGNNGCVQISYATNSNLQFPQQVIQVQFR